MFAYQFYNIKQSREQELRRLEYIVSRSAQRLRYDYNWFYQTLIAQPIRIQLRVFTPLLKMTGSSIRSYFTVATTAYLTIGTGTAALLVYAKGIAGDQVITYLWYYCWINKGGVPGGQTLTVDAGIYNYNGTDAGFKYTYVAGGYVW